MNKDSHNLQIEFSLFYIFEEIKKSYLIVIYSIIVSIIVGIIFFYNQDKTILITTDIKKIENKNIFEFQEINNYIYGSALDNENIDHLVITRENLQIMFIEKFVNRLEVKKAIRDKLSEVDLTGIDLDKYISELSKNFKIIDKNKLIYTSTFDELEFHRNILYNSINSINNNIMLDLESLIKKRVDWSKAQLFTELLELESDLFYLEGKYKDKIKREMIKLEEQIKIAKSINLASDITSAMRENSQLNVFQNLYYDSPLYYRGYIALEAELNNYLERDDNVSLYNQEYSEKSLKLKELKRKLDNFENEIAINALLNIDGFKAVDIDLLEYTVKRNFYNLLNVLTIFSVIGLLLSIIYILFTSGYKNYKLSD